ncbi:MAG: PAS domain S-box protein [Archangium sp.]|nr:PAS domain S-box protein [Archangium sp.]
MSGDAENKLRDQALAVAEAMRAFAEHTTDYSALLDSVVKTMATTVGGFCAIALPSEDSKWLEPVAMFDANPEALRLFKKLLATPISLEGAHVTTRVYRTGEPSYTKEIDAAFLANRFSDPVDRKLAHDLFPRSQLLVAMRVRGITVGLLSLVRHGAGAEALDDDDFRTAQTLADHAALAISNARLFEALSASEQRLRQIVETAHEGIWLTDAGRKTTYANPRMCEMLGVDPREMVGTSALRFVVNDDRSEADRRMQRRRAGVAEQLEIQLKRADGRVIDAAISVSTMRDARGDFMGSLALVSDITERKSLDEQLRQSQKMEAVGRLAGGVAHDFNNMLSVILSCTSLALEELPPDHSVRADLAEVLRAGERSRDLTKQILAFSRKQILKPRVLDPNEALKATEPLLRRLIGEDLQLTFALDPAVGRIKADPGQLEQVFMNLAINARDAMPSGGKLTIETRNVDLDAAYAQGHLETQPGPHVMIAVTDTGVGMDKETQARIFEPFFTTKAAGQGTGLGLSTVFGIVKQSGGSIFLYSEPGRGSTFKLYFPRNDEMPTPLPMKRPQQRAVGNETILLVEDESMLRNLVASILRRAGYQVLTASRPSEALHLAKTHAGNIELLFTDVVMPEMTGKQLADEVVGIRPTIRVLFMSGYTENSIVHHGVLDEGIVFLPKPITPDAVLDKVRTALS